MSEQETIQGEVVNFEKIIEQQLNEAKIMQKVVNVIKTSESLVRETVDKKEMYNCLSG